MKVQFNKNGMFTMGPYIGVIAEFDMLYKTFKIRHLLNLKKMKIGSEERKKEINALKRLEEINKQKNEFYNTDDNTRK